MCWLTAAQEVTLKPYLVVLYLSSFLNPASQGLVTRLPLCLQLLPL